MKLNSEELLDYYGYRLAVEEDAKGTDFDEMQAKMWHEKIELIYGEQVLCH